MSEGWIDLFRRASTQEAPRPIILALATIDAEGNPQVRSVVCRRLDDSGTIWITSDSRSRKNPELAAHPRAAASCWIASTQMQFRFRSEVVLCSSQSDRADLWSTLNSGTRATFFWPAPGLPRAGDASFIAASDAALPPETFSVLVMRPSSVELLELQSHPHRRRRWTAGNAWRVEELNP